MVTERCIKCLRLFSVKRDREYCPECRKLIAQYKRKNLQQSIRIKNIEKRIKRI